ncbi:MAG TPA: caspase family protein [Acetobacteraceae bacterium]|nr:caspase family protein [Acetobacteraceae bacterium]
MTLFSRYRAGLGALLCIFVIATMPPVAAQGPDGSRRVALVIGNFGYQHVPQLKNPGSDATLVATTLRRLGFTLVGGAAQQNLDKTQFDRSVQAFGRAIQGADVALFYYAGHGLQVDGKNWLVPIDANPTRPQDLDFQMVNADLVLQQMNGAGTRLNLVILDACRNNPFSVLGTRAVQGGLAQMRAPEGTMIAFATQPGNVATDGTGGDGPYAMALAAAMRQPGLDIFQTFNRVGLTVQHGTDGVQVPWVSSSPIDGEFYFTATDAASAPIAASAFDSGASVVATAVPVGGSKTERGAVPASAVPSGQATVAVATPGATPATPSAAAPGAAPAATASQAAAGRVAMLHGEAAQGRPDAQIDLGLAYAKGLGVARDYSVARQWFERAANQGAMKGQYYLGAMYERGLGGPRSYANALRWYRRAADQGYAPAEVALGRFYGQGLGVQRDITVRTDWYRRAALHNNVLGEWALGNFYQFGDGVPKDMAQARSWFERAAAQGFVPAEARLGLIYVHGIGVPRDEAMALYWFRKAADAGSPIALNNLGMFYRQGRVVPQDYTEAMRLFRLASDKGLSMADYNIGLMYANGHGVKTDKQQAHLWLEKAAAAGNQPAMDLLARQQAHQAMGLHPDDRSGEHAAGGAYQPGR